ncbi:unnamed protein product [Parnassius apollo]|uniref:(apollo) hypothetical protein n=1 Tax=Parnassius apollo TaxID=110799 RepID=A0A8S3YFV5_PARAO|nr:unnamed protein product [Parnassius apollo]
MESLTPQTHMYDTESVVQPISNYEQTVLSGTLDNPDLFPMSLDHVPPIGENVIINSSDNISVDSANITRTQPHKPNTPEIQMPETPQTPGPKVIETPKLTGELVEKVKIRNVLKLPLIKHNDDIFVKPSPLVEIMSPAKMLQFEIDITTSSTPTMKRAAVDFNFFNEHNFEEYFIDVPKDANISNTQTEGEAFIETPVIVKASTVRHEIGYGKYD